MRDHQIAQAAGPQHPPVVHHAGGEPHVPVRAMLAREQQRHNPERRRGPGSQGMVSKRGVITQRISHPRQNNSSTIGTMATARKARSHRTAV